MNKLDAVIEDVKESPCLCLPESVHGYAHVCRRCKALMKLRSLRDELEKPASDAEVAKICNDIGGGGESGFNNRVTTFRAAESRYRKIF